MARLIIGHVTDTTARIWVRGDDRHPVAFITLHNEVTGTTDNAVTTLEARHGYTGVVEFRGLTPSNLHHCEVAFGSTEMTPSDGRWRPDYTQGHFTTFPSQNTVEAFSFLLGSCNLHTLGIFGDNYPNFSNISEVAAASAAKFMIHCGDQIYADVPHLPWNPGIDAYRKRYLDAWSDNQHTQKFLALGQV